jgi:hypothetical protein
MGLIFIIELLIQSAQKSYKDYKQLAGLNDANIFTGANQFNSNTTEFAAKVSVGTRDPVEFIIYSKFSIKYKW